MMAGVTIGVIFLIEWSRALRKRQRRPNRGGRSASRRRSGGGRAASQLPRQSGVRAEEAAEAEWLPSCGGEAATTTRRLACVTNRRCSSAGRWSWFSSESGALPPVSSILSLLPLSFDCPDLPTCTPVLCQRLIFVLIIMDARIWKMRLGLCLSLIFKGEVLISCSKLRPYHFS